MRLRSRVLPQLLILAIGLAWAGAAAGETFKVATFNLENYLNEPAGNRPLKTPEAQAAVVRSILAIRPDVLAVQEMGTTNALLALRADLKGAGLDFPFWEHLTGSDTNCHVAVLSRYPFQARRPHTNETYLLSGRRFRVCRGFAEVDICVNAQFRFTLLAAHLKSRLPSPVADEEEMREQEALVLRRLVDARLEADSNAKLVVLGDFNDLRDSKPLRAMRGRGKNALFDTRPSEREGGERPDTSVHTRPVTWTFYYPKEDVYSRFDYILISPGMKREWLPAESYVLNLPEWGIASDHRPVVCSFEAPER